MPSNPDQYTISSNQRFLDRLQRLNSRAQDLGFPTSWALAVKSIFDRLKSDPAAVGDPYRRLERLKLTLYRILSERICVLYAIHDTQKIVFVREINPVLDHPLEGVE